MYVNNLSCKSNYCFLKGILEVMVKVIPGTYLTQLAACMTSIWSKTFTHVTPHVINLHKSRAWGNSDHSAAGICVIEKQLLSVNLL
jgi:hypothetical protein